MRYEVILFDADDTLFDYSQAEQYALLLTYQAFGLTCTDGHIESYRTINQ